MQTSTLTRTLAAGVVSLAVLTLAPVATHHASRTNSATLTAPSLAAHAPALSHAVTGAIGDIQWTERVYTAATGDSIDVSVSNAYPAEGPMGQQWADFFGALLHGPELPLLQAYVAPLSEVQTICGKRAVGCYGDDQLIVTNEPSLGFSPVEVARHEYGHHIASNRLNPPWPAIDWGPKRWATSENICARARSNDVYPGDEFLLYRLNPGEAFAEAYRVLVDSSLGQAQPTWPLVDSSFYPDQAQLDAVEQDVVAPWAGPTTRVIHARIQRPVWTKTLSTPLDGTIVARLTLAGGAGATLTLVAEGGRTILASGNTSRGRVELHSEICGQRSIHLRVTTRNALGRRIDLRVTSP
jgi:hypothetical protein